MKPHRDARGFALAGVHLRPALAMARLARGADPARSAGRDGARVDAGHPSGADHGARRTKLTDAEIEHRLYLARKAFERKSQTATSARSRRAPSCTKRCARADCCTSFIPISTGRIRHAIRGLSSALRDQRAAVVASRATAAHAGAQRRDQHHLGQSRAHRSPARNVCRASASPYSARRLRLDEPRRSCRVAGQPRTQCGGGGSHAAACRRRSEREPRFHRYHADCMEPWDGPSALVFTRWPPAGRGA